MILRGLLLKDSQTFRKRIKVFVLEMRFLSFMIMTKSKLLLLECSCLQLSGVARFSDGTIAEPDIPLVITIEDENDNPPYFEMHSGNITERSKKGISTIPKEKQ